MIYSIFQKALNKSPHEICIEISAEEKYSYFEVYEIVENLAGFLRSMGIKARERVPVLLGNEEYHIFLFLALDRINAIYIPLDYDIPQKQIEADLQKLAVTKAIIDENYHFETPLTKQDIVFSGFKKCDEVVLPEYNKHDDKTVYIVGSSGTTGEKKCIPIASGGLKYWGEVIEKNLQDGSSQNILCTRSPAYDARIFEYLLAFSTASTLSILNKKERKDFKAILDRCSDSKITCLLFIASQFSTTSVDETCLKLKKAGIKDLMVTGDECTPALKKACIKVGINLWNLYGPTEATFGLSMLCVNDVENLTSPDSREIVPIGKPAGNLVKYHIIDGELCIESPYLSPGYIGLENNPIRPLFKTGDRFLEKDGMLFCLGRYSHQSHCKVSGVKVTSQYIENTINKYDLKNPNQVQAIVVIKKHDYSERPVAYLTLAENFDKGSFLLFLKENLKNEEIPILYVIDEFPRTYPSNKIDRRALIAKVDTEENSLFAQRDTQKVHLPYTKEIKAIWQEVLGIKNIATNQEFTFLGGKSLQALTLVSKINETIDGSYSYQNLLALSTITIESIARSIFERKALLDEVISHNLVKTNSTNEKLFLLPALLGEGYFSYSNLAHILALRLNVNVIGLSEPGIYNEDYIPETLNDAVKKYVKAIKRAQPKGPYIIAGFSFGATLAYEVARALKAQGEQIKDVHLIDGFPPSLYQKLSKKDHALLLESLINFIIETLNNKFFAENLKVIKLTNFGKLNPDEQISLVFASLLKKVKSQPSRALLAVAKQHLSFMGSVKPPSLSQNIWATLYLSKQRQTYLEVIDKVQLDKDSVEYASYGWSDYFANMFRSGVELDCEHLGILRQQSQYNKSPVAFFERQHDPLFNYKTPSYRPLPCYQIIHSEKGSFFKVFFITQRNARILQEKFEAITFYSQIIPCQAKITSYEKRSHIATKPEIRLESYAHLYFAVPDREAKTITEFLQKNSIVYNGLPCIASPTHEKAQTSTLYISCELNGLVVVSYQLAVNTRELMNSQDNVKSHVQVRLEKNSESVFAAIRAANDSLIKIIDSAFGQNFNDSPKPPMTNLH